MFIALNEEGKRISIDDAERKGIYTCPICNTSIKAKKGDVNRHHFAHVNKIECDSWSEMSEWHKDWQDRFDEDYREIPIENHRADILKDGWIIEFQKSHLSEEEMKERIDFYTKNNKLIFVIDLRGKDIWSSNKKDIYGNMFYHWNHYSRSIISPIYNHKYYLFFQINDNEIIWVKDKANKFGAYNNYEETWKCIEAYRLLTTDQFVKYFNKMDSYKHKIEKNKGKIEKTLMENDFKKHFEDYISIVKNDLIKKHVEYEKDRIGEIAKQEASNIFNENEFKVAKINEALRYKIGIEENKYKSLNKEYNELLNKVENKTIMFATSPLL